MSIRNDYPTLDFGLGETADQLRDSVRAFTADKVAPIAAEIDKTDRFPRELWPQMGALGLHGITVEEEFGGSGLGYLEHVIAVEEISRGSASVGLSYGAHSNLCVNQIRRNGTVAQKKKYLPKLISGDHVGSLAMSESGAGSDVVSMALRADKKGDRYVLNGTKMWITNSPDATPDRRLRQDRSVSGLARHHRFPRREVPSFKGFKVAQKLDKLGMRGSNDRRTRIRGLRSARRERARPDRQGRQCADVRPRLRARGAGGWADRHHAGGDGYRHALHPRAQAVRQIDRRVPAHPGQGRRHVHRDERVAAPTSTPSPAPAIRGKTTRKDAAGAILFAAEKATKVALDAIQILGGNGYINDYPTGRLLRDAKLYEIGAGTSEIRRMLIGRELFEETK